MDLLCHISISSLNLKSMKKYFALLILIALPLVLRADPPKKITVTYNGETQKLKIVTNHPVKNVEDHFIDLISITVDEKEVKVIKPKKQNSLASETLEVVVPEIIKGSKVTVKARCNKFGSKSKSIVID